MMASRPDAAEPRLHLQSRALPPARQRTSTTIGPVAIWPTARWPEIDLMPVEAIDPRPGVHVFGIAPLKAIWAPVLSCRKTTLRLSSSIAQAWRQRVLTLIRPVVGAGKCCRTAHDTHQRSRNGGKAVSHSQLHCSKQPLRRYHGCRLVSQVEGPGGGYARLNRQWLSSATCQNPLCHICPPYSDIAAMRP